MCGLFGAMRAVLAVKTVLPAARKATYPSLVALTSDELGGDTSSTAPLFGAGRPRAVFSLSGSTLAAAN